MNVYSFQEGAFYSMTKSMKPVNVLASDGSIVGIITRGKIPGCEITGTFQFTPETGQHTSIGVRKGTLRSAISRLLRPSYEVIHDGKTDQFVERFGENFLYFAVRGELHGRQINAREDWDGSVKVTAQAKEIGCFCPGGFLADTRVEIAASKPGSPEFGLLVLLPLMHRIYKAESDALTSLFE
ncbi:hypothetical protein IV500_19215 [Paeniglutamicibacter antarcticus]|uniref:Uncharacterized protein n=1 Tax=Arthrobacter terrae TaxID=2935737 RepID=A0A931CR54_9MICC|nr:hypothetical protein [Arthrobacter terrae]MBG0741497.1 hypothetical protein [Arthrobacter terrae]